MRMKIGPVLLMMLVLGGCTRWQAASAPAPLADGPRMVGRARVMASEGPVMVLSGAHVTADSVIGWRDTPTGRRERVALHRSQVRVFERRALNPLPNALILLAAAYVIVVFRSYNNPDI